jgi:hypothetical protein
MKDFKSVKIPLLKHEFGYLIEPDKKKAIKIFDNYKHGDKNLTGTEACTFLLDGQSPLIWIKSKKDICSIAHEAVHAANGILANLGIRAEYGNDEILAYLVEHIIKEIIK